MLLFDIKKGKLSHLHRLKIDFNNNLKNNNNKIEIKIFEWKGKRTTVETIEGTMKTT